MNTGYTNHPYYLYPHNFLNKFLLNHIFSISCLVYSFILEKINFVCLFDYWSSSVSMCAASESCAVMPHGWRCIHKHLLFLRKCSRKVTAYVPSHFCARVNPALPCYRFTRIISIPKKKITLGFCCYRIYRYITKALSSSSHFL